MRSEEPKKFDAGKPRYDLIPAEALDDLAQLFGMGAEKYGDHNWRSAGGLKWSRVFAAMMRHAWAFWRGELVDPEDGQPHLISVAWAALVLHHYSSVAKTTVNDDRADRPSTPPTETR